MTMRLTGLVAAIWLAVAPVAQAETHTETIVAEQRTSVSVRISPEAAQTLMPAGWTANATDGAATLTMIFMDRKLALGPDGKPLGAGMNRLLVMSMSGKNTKSGQSQGLIVGGYSTDPTGVPGAYKVYGAGQVDVVRTERTDGLKSDTVEERWSVKAADGGQLAVNLTFARGLPTTAKFESKVHSGADPDFYRIYRGEQTTDVLRNGSGVDKVQSVTVQASGGKLGKLIQGSPQVTAVSNSPFYSRQTFLP